jgi:hypothetical protein
MGFRLGRARSAVEQAIDAMQPGQSGGEEVGSRDHTLPPPLPVVPAELLGPNDVQASTALFNGMIHPLCPFAIRGAIWYQGEANETKARCTPSG